MWQDFKLEDNRSVKDLVKFSERLSFEASEASSSTKSKGDKDG